VVVVGGGNSAAEESLFLARLVESVTLLVRGDRLQASHVIREQVLAHPRIEVSYRTAVERFSGAGGKLDTVHVRDLQSGAVEAIAVPGAFVFIGLEPNTAFLRASGVQLDASGFVVTGEPLASSVAGVFAAGDVRAGSTQQVASAAGEGAVAALAIRDFLQQHVGARRVLAPSPLVGEAVEPSCCAA
jgi:thioredoxin reductase (NADPH)